MAVRLDIVTRIRLEEAIARGYLVAPRTSRRLRVAWAAHCDQAQIPDVTVTPTRVRACVELDVLQTRRDLTDAEIANLKRVLRQFARTREVSHSFAFAYVRRENVPAVVAAMLRAASLAEPRRCAS